jgi:hypothetical protein
MDAEIAEVDRVRKDDENKRPNRKTNANGWLLD